jgi:hypothetical protein
MRISSASEKRDASGSVARPPGARTIRASTRGRSARRTDFVRRRRRGGGGTVANDWRDETGVPHEMEMGSQRLERVVVGGDETDDDDNRYPGTQHIIVRDGSVDGVDDAIQSSDAAMGSGRTCIHSHLDVIACGRVANATLTTGLRPTTSGYILACCDDGQRGVTGRGNDGRGRADV